MRALLFVAALASAPAQAAIIHLACPGEVNIYRAFGETVMSVPQTTLISLDPEKRTLKIELQPTGPLTLTLEAMPQRYYARYEFPSNTTYAGRQVLALTVNIERYSGKMNGIYHLDGEQMYGAVNGECSPAKPRF